MLVWACSTLLNLWRDVADIVHPVFYPFIPYWTIIMTALFITPVTILIPQYLQGKLSWPSKKDAPDVWTIYGKRYNLKPFLKQHPGGSWQLRACKGSDCTGLFESCHTFIDGALLLKMAAQFEIKDDGVMASLPPMVFSDPFYDDLKAMAREHFRGQAKGSHKMTWPHLVLSLSALGLYWVLIYQMTMRSSLWCIPFVGCLSWYLTGNMMHDASHNALMSTPWLNRLFSHAAFPYGVNVSAWHIQHILSHHIYTNDDTDVDLYHFDPVITMEKGAGSLPLWLHFVRIVYLLSTAMQHLNVIAPYNLLFGAVDPAHGHRQYDRINSIKAHRFELRCEMILEMVAQVVFWAICGYFQGWLRALGFQMMVFAFSSYLFSFFTQISHLQEECFPDPKVKEQLPFAKRQVMSSTDFSADSAVWGHLSGGLNTQAIHQCLPSVSAMHLRALYPKFREVCIKHGVELKEAHSLSSFLWGFISFSN